MDELVKKKIEKAFIENVTHLRSSECMQVKDYLLGETQKPFKINFKNYWEFGFLARISEDTVPERFIDFLMYEDNIDSYDKQHWAIELISNYFEFVLDYRGGVYEQKLLDFIHSIPIQHYKQAHFCYKKIMKINNIKYINLFIDFLKQAIIASMYDRSWDSTEYYHSSDPRYNHIYTTFVYCYELTMLIDKKSYNGFIIDVFKESLKKHYNIDGNERDRVKYSLPINILIELKTLLTKEEFLEIFDDYTKNSNIHGGYIEFLIDSFSDKLDYYLPIVLEKSFDKFYSSELIPLFKVCASIEYQALYNLIWQLATNSHLAYRDDRTQSETISSYNERCLHLAERDNRVQQAIKTLKMYDKLYFEYALKGLKSKDKKENYLSFLILFDNPKEQDKTPLKEAFHLQTDDKNVRNNFLDKAKKIFYDKKLDLAQVNEVIDYAQQRKKLATWKESFVLEKLPPIYLNNGMQLSSLQLHFLFYRMQQANEMEQDVEAMLLIKLLDKEKSQEASEFLLKHFMDNGGKAKEKYLMSLATLLGNESMIDRLIKLFNDIFDSGRMKMAQYVISAIALIGTDKALRYIDFISRKHKKKTALREYCLASLDSAAKMHNISRDELYDKLISDFGFDGIYKTVEVEGEEWRAYVGKDFKLYYVDENNQIKKTIPSKASKEIKYEFKEIQKELREVNKTQVDKLEQYMVKERTWDSISWQNFYLNNPLMFIYASTLIWELSSKNGKREKLFYIDEDGTPMDIDGEELFFEDMENKFIKIIHPFYLNKEEKQVWEELFYELEIVQPFLQLQRPVFLLEDSEKGSKGLSRYNNKKFAKGESAIKTFLEKRGYEREIEGGYIGFYKKFDFCNILVYLGISGISVIYEGEDEKLEISNTFFYKNNGNEAIVLEDIPQTIFSETVYDIDSFMES